jgi:hypothetical protein
MSSELVVALVGAVVGGIIALLGGIVQVFLHGWMSERGTITCAAVWWELNFDRRSWKEAKKTYTETYTGERSIDGLEHGFHSSRGLYSFTVNFFNKKGTNAAVLEYAVEFLRGKQTVVANLPTPGGMSAGQAVPLPAETVTGILMQGSFSSEEIAKILGEADRVEFTARLSSGPPIRVELEHLSQDGKGADKGDAT